METEDAVRADIEQDNIRKRKYEEAIKKMRLLDDYFMTAVFSDPKLAELLLKIIMKKPDLKVKSVKTQYNIKNLFGRSIRLDIVAFDGKGRIFNIEVQRGGKGASPKRARYHSSLIDAGFMEVGADFKDLPETYVIFITEHDYFKENKPLYKIERCIKGSRKLFGDGAHIIYVNGENRSNTKLGRLMADFSCVDPEKFHYKEIAEAVRYYKYDVKGANNMSGVFEEIFNEGVEKGIEKGERNKSVKVARNMIAIGKLTFDEIAMCSGLTVEEVKELAEKKTA